MSRGSLRLNSRSCSLGIRIPIVGTGKPLVTRSNGKTRSLVSIRIRLRVALVETPVRGLPMRGVTPPAMVAKVATTIPPRRVGGGGQIPTSWMLGG